MRIRKKAVAPTNHPLPQPIKLIKQVFIIWHYVVDSHFIFQLSPGRQQKEKSIFHTEQTIDIYLRIGLAR